jgi:cytochrome c5
MRNTVVYLGSALALAFSTSIAQADGAAIYNSSCAACHAQGVAGAPKFGDAAAWKDRIAQGNDTLYEHAIKGFQGKSGYMPPKGGFANLSDDEVKSAVDHMVSNSK